MSKIALITGANSGMGYQLVRLLAEKGYVVYLGARNKIAGKEAQDALESEGFKSVKFIHIDVTDAATIEAAKDKIEKKEGKLDILVNNAGISGIHAQQSAASLGQPILREVMDTNFFGLIQTTSTFVPLLRKSNQAVILNVSSLLASLTTMANNSWVQLAAYKASKAAVNSYTIELAHELKKDGIKVNVVNPGLIASKFNNYAAGGKSEKEGAQFLLPYAVLDADGPTGKFFNFDGTELPW